MEGDLVKILSIIIVIGINSSVLGVYVGKLSSKIDANEKNTSCLKDYIDDSIKRTEEKIQLLFASKQEAIKLSIESINGLIIKQDKKLENIQSTVIKIQLDKREKNA